MITHKISLNVIKYKIFQKKHIACEPRIVSFSSQKTEQEEIEKVKNNWLIVLTKTYPCFKVGTERPKQQHFIPYSL